MRKEVGLNAVWNICERVSRRERRRRLVGERTQGRELERDMKANTDTQHNKGYDVFLVVGNDDAESRSDSDSTWLGVCCVCPETHAQHKVAFKTKIQVYTKK